MSYAGKFLKAKGQDCTINRAIPVNTKVSIKRSTRASRDLGAREAYWEGLILLESSIKSGEILIIGTDKYLVQSANYDLASGELVFFAAKCNAVLQHKRYEETVDANGNLVQEWVTKNANVPVYAQVVTSSLRQFDPGLLEQTRYIIQVSKSIGLLMLDRFVFEDDSKYQVVSIDAVGMDGTARVQLGLDTRPD